MFLYPRVAQYLEVDWSSIGMSRVSSGSTLIAYPEHSSVRSPLSPVKMKFSFYFKACDVIQPVFDLKIIFLKFKINKP